MIKTIKLHVNKNEIFQKKNTESKETKQPIFLNTESELKNKNCNFSSISSQHIDGNYNIVSRDELHYKNKNYGRGNCNDKIGNEENQENVENS